MSKPIDFRLESKIDRKFKDWVNFSPIRIKIDRSPAPNTIYGMFCAAYRAGYKKALKDLEEDNG